jgi:hypothetical protein
MMKSTLVASITFAAAVKGAVQGFDISHYEPNVNFPAAYAAGARFVIIQVLRTCPLDKNLLSFLTLISSPLGNRGWLVP